MFKNGKLVILLAATIAGQSAHSTSWNFISRNFNSNNNAVANTSAIPNSSNSVNYRVYTADAVSGVDGVAPTSSERSAATGQKHLKTSSHWVPLNKKTGMNEFSKEMDDPNLLTDEVNQVHFAWMNGNKSPEKGRGNATEDPEMNRRQACRAWVDACWAKDGGAGVVWPTGTNLISSVSCWSECETTSNTKNKHCTQTDCWKACLVGGNHGTPSPTTGDGLCHDPNNDSLPKVEKM